MKCKVSLANLNHTLNGVQYKNKPPLILILNFFSYFFKKLKNILNKPRMKCMKEMQKINIKQNIFV